MKKKLTSAISKIKKCSFCSEDLTFWDNKGIIHELARYKPWEVSGLKAKLSQLVPSKTSQLTTAICYKCFMEKVVGSTRQLGGKVTDESSNSSTS
jgi:hypothetical protein